MDVSYVGFYVRNLRRRPRAEVIETAALLMTVDGRRSWRRSRPAPSGCSRSIYLIPERIAMTVLAWWFDWLPHHGLEETQRENRYRATRNRVGMEWLFTPLLLSQNYHLVHHLHPSVPFYRYVATWRRNEEAYLERDAAIATVFGKQLDPDEYREWKELNSEAPARAAGPDAGGLERHARRLPPACRSPRSTDHRRQLAVTFAVPEELRDEFRFEPGQHVTVRTDGRRACAATTRSARPPPATTLRIAVKHIPGGAFSTYAARAARGRRHARADDPDRAFLHAAGPAATKHYVAIAAGSGITPILSVLATTLEIETESRFTLIYGNRTAESTMFRAELDELESRYADRLEVVHVRSRERNPPRAQRPHRPRPSSRRWLAEDLAAPTSVDEWFLCGPVELVTMARDTLSSTASTRSTSTSSSSSATTRARAPQRALPGRGGDVRLSGREETAALKPGESILEAALQRRTDAPYACMGGACGTCRAQGSSTGPSRWTRTSRSATPTSTPDTS